MLSGCSDSADTDAQAMGAALPSSSSRVPVVSADPALYRVTGDLYVFAVGDRIVCGIGREESNGQMGNLTCHLPPGFLPNGTTVIDIDGSGVHDASWPRWSNAVRLSPGASLSVGTATCEVLGVDSVRCRNHGGWVESTPAGTRTSTPPVARAPG